MAHEYEVRQVTKPVEFRSSDSGLGVLAGYAAVFDSFSRDLGGFVEKVGSRAFNKSLSDGVPVIARYNHSDHALLGTTEGRTLRLAADSTGLSYEVDLPDTSAGRDVAILAARGDLTRSSFAFQTIKDEWSMTDQGYPLRTLESVRLVDVAPVNSPAYMDTTTGLRSLAGFLNVDLSKIKEASTDDLRALFEREQRGEDEEHEEIEQVDNHSVLQARRRMELDLLKLKTW